MDFTGSIRFVLEPDAPWQLCRNRSYEARIQRGDPGRVYNVPGSPGSVYNFLEDSFAPVFEGCFVVTGAMGEMWCIGPASIGKYGVDPEKVGFEPVRALTVELPDIYAAIRIPLGTEFAVRTDYGERIWLKGNRPGIGHGEGDFLLVRTVSENGRAVPDLEDCGRIINGELFGLIYRPAE